MTLRGFVEGGADDFGLLDGAHHIRHFFRALVNQKDNEVDVGIIGIDGIGQRLKQHCFARAGRGHDKPALAAADGGHDVDNPVGEIFFAVFHHQLLIGIDGREIVEKNEIFCIFRRFEADFRHLEQSEIAFAFLGRANLSGNHVALAQGKAADLRGRNVDIVRPRHVAAQGGSQEAETIRQNLQHAVAEDCAVLRGAGLQQRKNQFLLAHGAGVFYFILFRQLHQFLHAVRLERRQAEGTFGNGISGRDGFFPTRGLARCFFHKKGDSGAATSL